MGIDAGGRRIAPGAFILFDAVSYAAGVTSLSARRFLLATTRGMTPICFAVAALGADLIDASSAWMRMVFLAAFMTALPPTLRWLWIRAAKPECAALPVFRHSDTVPQRPSEGLSA